MIKIKKKEGRRWMRNEDREEGFLRGIVILPNLYCEEVGFGLAHFVALILIIKFKSKDRKDGMYTQNQKYGRISSTKRSFLWKLRV